MPQLVTGRLPARRRRLRVAEFRVQHEQCAEMIRVPRRVQADGPPVPGHPVQALAAELAVLAEVDGGVPGARRGRIRRCARPRSPRAARGSLLRGGKRVAGWWPRTQARAAVPGRNSRGWRLLGRRPSGWWSRGWHAVRAGPGPERAHEPGRPAQRAWRPVPGGAGEPQPFLVDGACLAGVDRDVPVAITRPPAGRTMTAWCRQCMPETGSGWTGKVRSWCTPVSLHQTRWLSGSLDA